MRCCRILVWVGLVLAIVRPANSETDNAKPTSGQTGDAKPASDLELPWRFQRLLVPADRPEDWPRDKHEHYLPMPADEFEQRLAQLRGQPLAVPQNADSQLVRAEYTAQWSDGNLVDGHAVWEFQHKRSQRDVVVLGNCLLPLADVRWQTKSGNPTVEDDRKSAAEDSAAIVGNDYLGRLAAVIDRTGAIEARWSLRGERQTDGVVSFDLQIPSCQMSLLTLSLPPDLTPSVDRGFVSVSQSSAPGRKSWRIDLGGNGRAALKIAQRGLVAEPSRQPVVRQSARYEISPHGLELTADIELNSPGIQGRKIQLLVDRPLSLVGVRLNDQFLTTTPSDTADREAANSQSYAIELPASAQEDKCTLRIVATQPWPLDAKARLPLVRVGGARWESGSAKLIVSDPLVVSDLLIQDCRQTVSESNSEVSDPTAAKPASGEIAESEKTIDDKIDLQFFNDHPTIDLALSRRNEKISVEQGTAVLLRANEGSAHCRANFSAVDGEQFTLEAEIAPLWIIESVDSIPAGIVADWSQRFVPGRPGRLTLQLSEPLSPRQDVQVLINARRRRAPWGDTFHANDLSLVNFLGAANSRRIVQVQSSEFYQLQLHGAEELNRLDPSQLSEDDAALLPESPAGLAFVSDENARTLSVSLAAKAAQFEADIRADATVSDDRLSESYRFAITPQGRELGRFTVRFSQPRAAALTWSIEGEPNAALSARRVPEKELSSSGLAGGEVWDLTLPSPRSTPFVVIAHRSSPLIDDMPVALASVIEAESQRGTVQIHSTGRNVPEVVSRRKAIPIEPPTAGQIGTAVAAFRYEPEEDALLSVEPPLVIALKNNAAKQTWIWQAQLESRATRVGSEHVLTCKVESAGRSRIQFQPPAGAHGQLAWVDDQPVAATSADGSWRINLPSGAKFATVVLQWSDDEPMPGIFSSYAAPWPTCDVPILSRSWAVWLPPGRMLADADLGGVRLRQSSWLRRLFGPLIPGSDEIAATVQESTSQENSSSPQEPTTSTGLLSPWKSEADHSLNSPHWNAYRFDGLGDSTARVWIAAEDAGSAWAWSLFVLALAGRWWLGRHDAAVDFGLLGAATSIALLIPARFAPFSAAVWLGLVAGRLLVWIWPAVSASERTAGEVGSSKSTVSKMAAAGAMCFLVAMAGRGLALADGGDQKSNASSPLRQVLIPVDAAGHSIGGMYYLPEAFHDELQKATLVTTTALPKYLIVSADYRASNLAQSGGGNWWADLEIESLAENVSVELPLGLDGASLMLDGVRLDGQAAGFHAALDRQRIAVEISHAGKHRLEIEFRPIDNKNRIDFAVPAVAQSLVELGADFPFELKSALGVGAVPKIATASSTEQRHAAWLGPAARIVLEPRSGMATSASDAQTFDVDQLDWLHVRPDSVTMDARLHVRVNSGHVQQLRMTVDPRWQAVLPPAGAAIQVRQRADNPRDVVVTLSRPIVGQGTVDISFSLPGASGFGNWQPPRLEILGAHEVRRWQGVTVDPALDFKSADATAGTVTVPPEKFLALWASGEAKPQLAWQAAAGAANRQIDTKPIEAKSTARYEMAAIAEANDVALRLSAVVTSNTPLFQFRLTPPPQMEIESVSMRQQNADLACRWSRGPDGSLSVFPSSPVTGECQLIVTGNSPLVADGKFTLPSLEIQDCASTDFRAFILRRRETSVEVTNLVGMKPIADSNFAATLAAARRDGLLPPIANSDEKLLTVLDGPRDFRPAVLQINRNQPQISIAQVTTMNRSAEGWTARVDSDLNVEHGLVDTLRFDLPANWIGPFEISPSMPSTLEDVPGENRRQLVLRPEKPLESNLQLRITGPLTIATGQRPSVPDVRLAGATDQTLYFMLPRRQENQQLAWDVRRLIPTKQLPASLSAVVPDMEAYLIYQLLGDHPRANLRSAQRTSDSAQVRLADVALCWSGDGRCSGVAAFDLEAGGRTACEVEMPAGCQIIHAELDSAPAQITPSGEHRFSIWLGDNKLPRRLEIVFSGGWESQSGGLQFAAPSLVGLPVEKTLWTILAPQQAGKLAVAPHTSVSATQHALLRLEQTTTLANSAAALLVDEPVDDVARWYSPWMERFIADRTSLIHAKRRAGTADDDLNVNAKIAELDQNQSRLERRLETESFLHKPSTDHAAASNGIDLPLLANASNSRLSYAVHNGEDSILLVDYPNWPTSGGGIRKIFGVLIGLATLGFLWGRRRGSI